MNGLNVLLKMLNLQLFAIKTGIINEDNRTLDFKMRPEQEEALKKQLPISKVLKKKILIKHLIFFGMPKCVLVKPLLHISLQKK